MEKVIIELAKDYIKYEREARSKEQEAIQAYNDVKEKIYNFRVYESYLIIIDDELTLYGMRDEDFKITHVVINTLSIAFVSDKKYTKYDDLYHVIDKIGQQLYKLGYNYYVYPQEKFDDIAPNLMDEYVNDKHIYINNGLMLFTGYGLDVLDDDFSKKEAKTYNYFCNN